MQSSPGEIIAQLKKVSPFQRTRMSESYKGQFVEWDVTFIDVFSVNQNSANLYLHDANNELIPTITCVADLNTYPEFKIIEDKTKFSLRGKIKDIDGYTIKLEDCEFFLHGQQRTRVRNSDEVPAIFPTSSINIHNSPGASIIHDSHVTGNSGGNHATSKPANEEGWRWWLKTIITGVIVAVVGIGIAYYFNLNGNKKDSVIEEQSMNSSIISFSNTSQYSPDAPRTSRHNESADRYRECSRGNRFLRS